MNVLRLAVLLIVILSIQIAPIHASLSESFINKVDNVVLDQVESQNLVGVAVALIKDGTIVYVKGYGFADVKNDIPVSEKTMFRWASISKPLAAVAAMQLWEQGKFNLESDVRGLVPEFPKKQYTITPRQLLCHQSGIVHYRNGRVIYTDGDYDTPHPYEDMILALDTFKKSPLLFKPGKKFSYSTHGYILLGAAVKRAGKQKFADQVHDRIAKPLGMKTLQPDYQWKNIPHRSKGYTYNMWYIIDESGDTDVSWKLPGGGFISTVEDLGLFACGLMNGDLVKFNTERKMWEQQKTANGKLTDYALGFNVVKTKWGLNVSHGGSQEKAKTRMSFYPDKRIGVVIMCNTHHAKVGLISSGLFNLLRESEK
jgi:CubicO group peptidase (beta-lactamase class C family)